MMGAYINNPPGASGGNLPSGQPLALLYKDNSGITRWSDPNHLSWNDAGNVLAVSQIVNVGQISTTIGIDLLYPSLVQVESGSNIHWLNGSFAQVDAGVIFQLLGNPAFYFGSQAHVPITITDWIPVRPAGTTKTGFIPVYDSI